MTERSAKIKILTLLVYICAASTNVFAQVNVKNESAGLEGGKEDWTLRLIRMEQNVSASPNELVFGCWNMQLKENSDGTISGSIEKDGWRLPLTGKRINDTFSFSASGSVGSDHWRLDWVSNPPAIVAASNVTEKTRAGTAVFHSQLAADDNPVVCNCLSIKRTPYPTRPIRWKLNNNDGTEFGSNQLDGKPALIVFSQGFSCVHCNEQIKELQDSFQAFGESEATVLVLVSDSNQNLTTALKETRLPFEFLADPDLRVFKKFGLDDKHRTHGVAILDGSGVIKWASVGHEPEMNIGKLADKLKQVAKSDLAEIQENLTSRNMK